ncbi:plexin-C1-like [Triplophysa rosa]|uniref:plexin-C1-like n=1 Tax=Triplophysa rosa TaxID=992332 RepID=UPI0025460643|nr:plexin-C1-like [Triplophysa rosa]
MKENLLGMLFLLKYCVCDNVRFGGDIKNFVVGNSKLYVVTDHRLHQMRHDLFIEKTKEFNGTQPNCTLLVPFEANGTLITCGTSNGLYCEVLDLGDITNTIYWEGKTTLPKNETSVAFILDTSPNNSPNGAYLLVGEKERSLNNRYTIVTLWSTLHSQPGSIFSTSGERATPYIHTERDVEFIDGFQIISRKLSYLFLNALTESGWKAYVLRLNNAKGKKEEIIRDFKGSTLECCSDKARPLLLASARIPSDKAVLWTGVFSAQNGDDPENNALAVYDISNIDGTVNSFCTWIKNPRDAKNENDPKHQPLAVVFKYKSISSVAAVRDGSWIVLFMGTTDGQLIKLVLDERFSPGCPTVLYRSDDDQEFLPRMHLDPVDSKYIYIALKNQIRRVPVVQCVKHTSLRNCRAAFEPFCGWCVNQSRCSTQNECSKSSWVSFSKDSLQKQLISFQVAKKSPSEIHLNLALSLESTQNPAFSCKFTTGGVNLCDRSDPAAVFPNCSCSFSDDRLPTGGLEVSATVTIGDQMITETLMLKNCPSITNNSTNSSYTQCVLCASAGWHWSSSFKRCDRTHGNEAQFHRLDPEILSIKPNKVSLHGRNSVLLTGRNLESVTKIRIQGVLDCIQKEYPVFDRSSRNLRFHMPPGVTKRTMKVCAVDEDGRCHGNSIITYSFQPTCTGIQPKVTWRSGGRTIHVQGTNMEVVESIVVHPSNKELRTQYNTSSRDLWFYTHPYDGSDTINLVLQVANSTLNCADLTYQPDPVFNGFTTTQLDNDILVIIKKNADKLNLSMKELDVSGLQEDQEYECVLGSIASTAIMCKIKAIIQVDSLTIRVGRSFVLRMGQSSRKYLFCLKPQGPS